MFITLRCRGCHESSPVAFETLLGLWKQGYDQMTDENKPKAKVFAEVTCDCGHVTTYDTPMFRYFFQVIFDDYIKKTGF